MYKISFNIRVTTMRVLHLLHRVSLRCCPGKRLLCSLYGPDQRRRLQIKNNPTGSRSAETSTGVKEGVTFDTPFTATGWSKSSHPGLWVLPTLGPKVSAEVALRRGLAPIVTMRWLPSASSLLFAVSVHLLPLRDHLIQLLQARLQALAVQSWAALRVVHGGGAELMKIQHLLDLNIREENSQCRADHSITADAAAESTFKSSTNCAILDKSRLI